MFRRVDFGGHPARHHIEIIAPGQEAEEAVVCDEMLEAMDQARNSLRLLTFELVELVDDEDRGQAGIADSLDHERQVAVEGLDRSVADKGIVEGAIARARSRSTPAQTRPGQHPDQEAGADA